MRRLADTAAHNVLVGQMCFVFFSFVCFALDPEAFWLNAPLSYYGTQLTTIIPAILGIATTVFFLLRGASKIRNKRLKLLQFFLRATALLLLALLFSPYTINYTFWITHMTISFLLLAVVVAGSSHVLFALDKRPLSIFLAFSVLLSGVSVTLCVFQVIHVAALTELLFSSSFNLLFFNTLKDAEAHKLITEEL